VNVVKVELFRIVEVNLHIVLSLLSKVTL
jgi:hypothetical protein